MVRAWSLPVFTAVRLSWSMDNLFVLRPHTPTILTEINVVAPFLSLDHSMLKEGYPAVPVPSQIQGYWPLVALIRQSQANLRTVLSEGIFVMWIFGVT